MSDTIAKKNDTIVCPVDNREFTPVSKKQIYCSVACKLKANRIKHRGGSVSHTSVNDTIEIDDTITKTDQLFVDDVVERNGYKNWYKFDKEPHKEDCWQCKKRFETRLKLNRYCSPACRDKALERT